MRSKFAKNGCAGKNGVCTNSVTILFRATPKKADKRHRVQKTKNSGKRVVLL